MPGARVVGATSLAEVAAGYGATVDVPEVAAGGARRPCRPRAAGAGAGPGGRRRSGRGAGVPRGRRRGRAPPADGRAAGYRQDDARGPAARAAARPVGGRRRRGHGGALGGGRVRPGRRPAPATAVRGPAPHGDPGERRGRRVGRPAARAPPRGRTVASCSWTRRPSSRTAVLQTLRQPLEHGELVLHRAAGTARYPARFQLVLAANPCPCGQAVGKGLACTCRSEQRRRYFGKLSGPLLDRVDLQVELEPARAGAGAGESVGRGRARVLAARAAQARPARRDAVAHQRRGPGQLAAGAARARIAPSSRDLDRALDRGTLSLRGVDRVLRVAWTVGGPGRSVGARAGRRRARPPAADARERRMSGDDAGACWPRATWSALGGARRRRRRDARRACSAPSDALEWVRAARPARSRTSPGSRTGAVPLADADRARVSRKAVARWAVRLPDCDPRPRPRAPRPARRHAAGAGRPAMAVRARRSRDRGAVLPVGPRRAGPRRRARRCRWPSSGRARRPPTASASRSTSPTD